MRYLIATDKFKGTLTAREACRIIEAAIRREQPGASVALCPIGDGGEGTIELIATQLGADRHTAETVDALGRPVTAEFFANAGTGFIEMSAASGLWRIEPAARRPFQANTWGTGVLLRRLHEQGARKVFVGLGGSATVDLGIGAAAAGGSARFEAGDLHPSQLTPATFARVASVRCGAPFAEVVGLADVETPLVGSPGAIRVYGPQKGLQETEVQWLEREVQALTKRLAAHLPADFSQTPRSGAAGGFGYGVLAFFGGRLVSGFTYFAEAVSLENRIAQADIVITGEGKLDAQTAEGKGPCGVARLARTMGKPVWAVAGVVEPGDALNRFFEKTEAMASGSVSVEQAMAEPEPVLYEAARRLVSSGEAVNDE